MAKIILQKMVKYNGKKIYANVPFNVEDKDLGKFVDMGCHIFEEPKEEIKTDKK